FKEKRIGAAGVERVRTSFYSNRGRKATRIVFDLSKDVPYRLIDDGGGAIRIIFGNTASAPRNQTAGPVVVPEPASYSVSSSTSPALKLASLLPRLEPPAPPEVAPPEVSASAPRAQAPLAAAVSSPPQLMPVTSVLPTAPQVPTTPTPIPQYQGDLISIDIKDYDIKDFFRLISEISGLNVVLDPNVGGTVTLKLTDVPWDQALDVVLKNYQLGGQLQGN